MTSTRAINAAAGVIHACIQQGKPLPVSIAFALEAAGLLNSPEHAAEVAQLHTDLDGARLSRWEEEQDAKRARFAAKNARRRAAALRARVVELEAGTAAVLALHVKYDDSEHCQHDGERWPCPTVQATPFTTAELAQGAADAAFLAESRPVDEDPIAYSLTPEALHASSGAVIEPPVEPLVEPNGCGLCGIPLPHGQQWTTTAGLHGWAQPTDEQIKERMRRRRSATKLRGLLARQRAAVEEPHDDPVGLHHDYRTPRDLPPAVTP